MDNVSELHRPIEFTIDGRPYKTTGHRQLAAELLRLASLDPTPPWSPSPRVCVFVGTVAQAKVTLVMIAAFTRAVFRPGR